MSEKTPERVQYLNAFREAKINTVMTLPINLVKPSQVDDSVRNESQVPIEGCLQEGFILVTHGNHRYWTKKTRGHEDIRVKKVEDPYMNW